MMITFHDPSVWALCLLVILPLLMWRWIRSKGDTVAFSSTQIVAGLRPSLRVRLRWLPGVIRLLALAILILALARPQMDNRETKITSEGIAIEMLVDRSPSMRAEDFHLGGKSVDRLTAVKDVAGKFLLGDEGNPVLRVEWRWHYMAGSSSDVDDFYRQEIVVGIGFRY